MKLFEHFEQESKAEMGEDAAVQLRAGALWAIVGKVIGVVLLMISFIRASEGILRRIQPDQPYGRYAPWHYPRKSLSWLLDGLANSRFARFVCHFIPMISLISTITNVVYVNYLVEASLLEPLVPPGLTLQKLGKDGRYALFTFLVYQHGYFGPRLPGPLRLVLPSPLQTNWRIYVRDPHTKYQGVYFVTNAITNTLYGLGARLLTEGMPMHVLQQGTLTVHQPGTISLLLDPGRGSGPDAQATLYSKDTFPVEGPWRVCFENYRDFLAYCVPQDRALSSQPQCQQITRQEISMHISLKDCQPLAGEVYSSAVRKLVGDAPAFCFYVPHVNFQFEREIHDKSALQARHTKMH